MIFLDPFDQSYMSLIDSYLSFVITTINSPFRIHPYTSTSSIKKKIQANRESYSSKVLLTSWNFFGSKGITLFQANRLVFFQLTRPIGIHLALFFFFRLGSGTSSKVASLLIIPPPHQKKTKCDVIPKRRASSLSFDLYNKKAATKQHN